MRRIMLIVSLLSLAACSRSHPNVSQSCGTDIIAGHRLSAASPMGSSTVFITIQDTDGKDYACSGTLIGSQLVLTAQHCVDNASKIGVIFSASAMSTPGELDGPMKIADSWAKYGPSYATPHDLAVLHLDSPAPAGYVIQTLPAANYNVDDASSLTAAGFGVTSECGSDDGTLRATNISMSDLVSSYDFQKDGQTLVYTEPGMLLIDQSQTGICHGDSGGPLYAIDRDGHPQIVGVTSYNVNVDGPATICHGVGAFTDIRLNLDWINQVSTELNDHEPVEYK